jgi:hypothetical protein
MEILNLEPPVSSKFEMRRSTTVEFLNQISWRITDPNINSVRVPDYPVPSTPSREVLYTPLPEFADRINLYFPYVNNEILSKPLPENASIADIIKTIYDFYSTPARIDDIDSDLLLKNIQSEIRVLRSDVMDSRIYFKGLTPYNDGYLLKLVSPS